MTDWGRFTVRGSSIIETTLSALLSKVADDSSRFLPPDVCRAMVLLGGYGRGEGGVVFTPEGERPHNNLDFLVITGAMNPAEQEKLKTKLRAGAVSWKKEFNVELDFAVIPEMKLRRSPCLVMWYDMRFGHKTVLGDKTLVPSLKQFTAERIPAWDICNLLVNRGTLLVLNDHLAASRVLQAEDRKLVVKHVMKAVIGYGDALLYFLKDYHWSYAEKQKRMRARTDIGEGFRRLYDQAIEFRFQPDYAAYENNDLMAWMDSLRVELAAAHLRCESMRLNCPSLQWDTYPGNALAHAVFDDWKSARAWVKKLLNAARTREHIPGASPAARLGFRCLGFKGALPTLFPVPAYALESPGFRELAAHCLGARSLEIAEIRRAYLSRWASLVDTNADAVLKKWNITLNPDGAPK
jgi:hypothetical protein